MCRTTTFQTINQPSFDDIFGDPVEHIPADDVSSSSAESTSASRKTKSNSSTTAVHTGKWTEEEHFTFLQGIEKFGKSWKVLSNFMKTRSASQIRAHAQKYLMGSQIMKRFRDDEDIDMDGIERFCDSYGGLKTIKCDITTAPCRNCSHDTDAKVDLVSKFAPSVSTEAPFKYAIPPFATCNASKYNDVIAMNSFHCMPVSSAEYESRNRLNVEMVVLTDLELEKRFFSEVHVSATCMDKEDLAALEILIAFLDEEN